MIKQNITEIIEPVQNMFNNISKIRQKIAGFLKLGFVRILPWNLSFVVNNLILIDKIY
jgi:hypothetical protein